MDTLVTKYPCDFGHLALAIWVVGGYDYSVLVV